MSIEKQKIISSKENLQDKIENLSKRINTEINDLSEEIYDNEKVNKFPMNEQVELSKILKNQKNKEEFLAFLNNNLLKNNFT